MRLYYNDNVSMMNDTPIGTTEHYTSIRKNYSVVELQIRKIQKLNNLQLKNTCIFDGIPSPLTLTSFQFPKILHLSPVIVNVFPLPV